MYNQVFCKTKAVFSRCLKPFKRQESHEVKDYGNCCINLQKNDLFTGFSEIAKSKKCHGMAVKLFVLLFCTIGFIYQTWSFMQMYLAYPVTLEITDEYPDSFIDPAVTICNKNRLLRQPYCKKFPEKCSWEHTTWETFCEKHNLLCPKTQPRDFSFGIPKFQNLGKQNNSNAFLNDIGQQEEPNMIFVCLRLTASGYKKCNSSITWIQVPRNGFPYKCFSLFSLLGEHNEEQRNVTMSNGLHILFHMHPEEQFNSLDLPEVSFALHDPRKLVNPMKEGITLTSGIGYTLFPLMEKKERLPPPYTSKCMDYLSEWKENGGSGPLSKDLRFTFK